MKDPTEIESLSGFKLNLVICDFNLFINNALCFKTWFWIFQVLSVRCWIENMEAAGVSCDQEPQLNQGLD